MTSLNHDFPTLSNWFYKNFMVLHLDKCSFMLFGIKDELQTDLLSNNVTTKNSKQEKVLGITFDNKLDFSSHLTSITKRVKNIKLNSLIRVQKCMTPGQKILLTSFFIKSHHYCFLIWISCLKKAPHGLKSIHEKYLRLIHQKLCLKLY